MGRQPILLAALLVAQKVRLLGPACYATRCFLYPPYVLHLLGVGRPIPTQHRLLHHLQRLHIAGHQPAREAGSASTAATPTHTHTFARPCHPHRPPCPRPRGCPTCRVARLRRQFLELIDFNVSITASLYASYYFELRTLCEKAERGFTFKPLSEAQQRKLELNSGSRRKELKVSKRWKSRDSSDR